MAWLMTADRVQGLDQPVITWVQSLESPTLTSLASFCAWLGSTGTVVIISLAAMAFLFYVLHHRRELVLFLIVCGGSALINVLFKQLFMRERPTIYRILEETGYSFPSGHAMGAFSLYAVITFLLWRHIHTRTGRGLLIFIATGFILTIGISRIYAGVHYPSDILAGYLIAGSWFSLCVYGYQWLQERRAS